MRYTTIPSPVGEMLLAGDDRGLTLLSFRDAPDAVAVCPQWIHDRNHFCEAIHQLDAYFIGALQSFSLAIHPRGTVFQQQVWQRLRAIPYGQTVSYGQIAREIGMPQAARAVGTANGQNPLPIIIPCHRVIGSTGRLVGYSCGLGIKRALLSLEQRHAGSTPDLFRSSVPLRQNSTTTDSRTTARPTGIG